MNFLNQTFKRRRVLKILGVSAVGAITGGVLINSFKHKVHKAHWQGISLGSPAEIIIYHHEKDKAESIIEKSVKRINYLENLFSLYKKDSQLSILNEKGTLESPASEMLNLMYLSKKYAKITNGAFDITVQPLWKIYKDSFAKFNRPPHEKVVVEALSLVNIDNISIEKNKIEYSIKGMSSTLNGIAQGYITDKISEIMIDSGIKSTLIQIGEYRGIGEHPEGRPWRLLISNPEHTSSIGALEFRNKAVATSAGMGTIFENSGKYNHIFDPKNGMSPSNHLQTTVLAETATEADALSTAFLILNKTKSTKIAKDRNIGFEVLDNKQNREIITVI